MANNLKIWDLKRLTIVLCGLPIEGGYGEDEVLKLELTDPTFTTKKGADGDVTRSKTYNGHCTLTLTLMQSSSDNALLSTLHELDRISDNGAGVGPTSILDKSGGSYIIASKSWISKPAEPTFGREATHNNWTIETADVKYFLAGN